MNAADRKRLVAEVRQRYSLLKESMDERVARHWAATEAIAIGHGGGAIVAEATGMAPRRIGLGKRELHGVASDVPIVKVRRRGGGRRPHEEVHPELVPALLALVDPETRGDPESSLRWSKKSTHALSAEMFDAHGIRVGDKTVARLLRENGYSLQATHKTVEGKQHPDRDAQFKHINRKAADCAKNGVPFISVDTKKKELVGNFKNAGVEWQPKDTPELVDVHDFPDQVSPPASEETTSTGITGDQGPTRSSSPGGSHGGPGAPTAPSEASLPWTARAKPWHSRLEHEPERARSRRG